MLATAAAIFSILLIITGVAKVARPHDVAKALVALGLPRLPGVGVVVGGVEITLGVGSLLLPVLLIGQGLAYVLFAGWVALALRSDVPIASCGCLGRDDTPPTVAHIVLNILAGALSLGAAAGTGLVFTTAANWLAQVTVIAVGVFLSYVVLNQAARLVVARSA